MSYTRSILKTWRDNHLFSALIELTYRCNLDCFFCYNDLELKGTPLELTDYEHLLDQLVELGCLHLTLSGGEPLSHPDFFTIGGHARRRGFVVRIKTNGHALNERMARRIQDEIDPYMIETSLHGCSAATHDRQTRVAGSFERLQNNLETLRNLGLRFKLNTTLTRWNEHQIEGMYEIADRFGVQLQIDPEVTPRDDGDLSPLDISPTASGLERLFRHRAERASRLNVESVIAKQGDSDVGAPSTDKHCGAGSSGIAVDPVGNVYPCVQWRVPIGNVHRQDLATIWRGEAVNEIRDLTVAARDELQHVEDQGRYLNFCPGAARMNTGSPIRIDAGTLERGRIAKRASALPVHPLPEG